MAVPRELFIYYRVRTEDADALRSEVLALQQRLSALHPGLTARLLRRPEPADGWHTWMETYAWPGHVDGVSEALEQSIERHAALALQRFGAARHVEAFVACAS